MNQGTLAGFGAGALFGVGLVVSGMTRPSKVVGFLDVFGAWDASLAFVMVGAILVHFVAHRLITRRRSPLFEARFHLPRQKDVDARLVLGAAIFGVGWGLGGYCPGPGLVGAASGAMEAIFFVVGMSTGVKIEHLLSNALVRHLRHRRSATEPSAPPPTTRVS